MTKEQKLQPRGATIADYEIGKGKPPRATRWKKGCASPNPKGRPKKPQLGQREMNHFLDEKITLTTDAGPQVYTKREVIYLQLINRAVKGDNRATRTVLDYIRSEGDGAPTDPLLFDEGLTEQLLAGINDNARPQKRGVGANVRSGPSVQAGKGRGAKR